MNYQQQQPQFFSSYPTENSGDINWAQLAQRWIQTQHSQQQSFPPQPPPPPPPPPSRLPYSQGVSSAPVFHGMSLSTPPPNRTPGPGLFPTPLSHVSVGPPNWRPLQNCAHPSFNIGYQSHGIASAANYSYFSQSQGPSERHDDEEYQAHYDPSLEQEESTDQRPPEMCSPQGAMTQWMANPWNAAMYPSNYMPIIDTQMRKKLPAWILEGLEKAEREKQKKIEKEEYEKKRKEMEEEKQKQREAKGIGKFDDDSNDEEDECGDNGIVTPNNDDHQLLPIRKFREFVDQNKKDEAEIDEDPRTDEQRTQEALIVVRRLMTTVLLETTDREIKRIANNMLTRRKNKAQPKILAQSTALAALTSLVDSREKRRSALGIDAASSSSTESSSEEERTNRKRKSKRKRGEETKVKMESTETPAGKRSRK
ncbi:hypothetical protein niasHS_002581 [Heterodera schachtii]|uniref:Uncharacterized protein n=1 Tax=Heterodera schachtii TaxID=97005 RepID=A0ABD2KKC6_HETSC